MIFSRRRSPRISHPAGIAPAFLALLFIAFRAGAQVPNTVRDNEFRSRWADYQVDHPQTTNANPDASANPEEQAGLLRAFSKSFDDLFRNGPLQTRATLSAGWEYSNENNLVTKRPDATDNSFFVAPGVGFFYNNRLGPAAVSARYSAGYVYYLDRSYIAAGNGGGIFSNTAGLDVSVEGLRSTLASSSSLSYGDGNDIESGTQRTLFSLSETATASYILSTFTRVGFTGGASYSDYSGGGVGETDLFSDTASVYIEYAHSPKTRGRFELAAGQQTQSASGAGGGTSTADRYYYQALLSADYLPSPKLNFSVGAGCGVQNSSDVIGRGRSGAHPIYRITVQYVPTPKTTALLRFGYEGVDTAPSLSLQVDWQFRLTTAASLSIYQNSNFSTYEVNQNLLTRGVLGSVQERLFGRVDLALTAGIEQSEGYGKLLGGRQPYSQDPYEFAGASLSWEINSYLALQTYYRVYSGAAGAVVQQNGLQSRAAISLRLTF